MNWTNCIGGQLPDSGFGLPLALLILDLDETLLFSSEVPLERAADIQLLGYHVYLRPYLREFLRYTFRYFHVAVWTSSGSVYAERIVQYIFSPALELSGEGFTPEAAPYSPLALKFVWSSERCTRRIDSERDEWVSVKNLRKIKQLGYALERAIVVDDSPEKHLRNYGNLIQVQEYKGAAEDDELRLLATYLPLLEHEQNVRTVEKRSWRSEALRLQSLAAPLLR